MNKYEAQKVNDCIPLIASEVDTDFSKHYYVRVYGLYNQYIIRSKDGLKTFDVTLCGVSQMVVFKGDTIDMLNFIKTIK